MYSPILGIPGDTRFQKKLRRWAFGFAVTIQLYALLVLTGWQFNIVFLKSPLTHQVPINPVTGIALLLAASSFLLLISSHNYKKSFLRTGYILAEAGGIIGLWKLLNLFGVIGMPVDELLFYPQLQAATMAGKESAMAANTAFCLVLVNIALLWLPIKAGKVWVPAQFLALALGGIAFFSILSYLYGVHAISGMLWYVPMGLNTALCFFMLSLAIFFATPDAGLMKTFTGLHPGSMVARFLIPTVILVPVCLGLLRLYGHRAGLLTPEFGVTVLVLSIIIFFLALTWYTVRLLNIRDIDKEAATLALQKSEEATKYQALLLQNISDAVISTDIDFRIVSWNKAAQQMYGWTEADALNSPFSSLMNPVYEQATGEEVMSSYFKNGHWKGEVKHQKKNGDFLSVLVSTTVIQKEGVNTGTVAVIRDITDRRKIEQRLKQFNEELEQQVHARTLEIRESEKKYRTLVEEAVDGITVFSLETSRCLEANKRMTELLGYSHTELMGKPATDFFSEEELRHQPVKLAALQQGMTIQAECMLKRRDGTAIQAEANAKPLENGRVLVFIRDITERKAAGEQILQINEELRQLSARFEDVREQERIRIAREIHDELGQQLTGLRMDIAWLSKKVANDEPIRKKFAGALALTDEMVKTVRRISTELRPAVLDDLGLAAAIEWQSAEFEKRFNIKVNLVIPDNNPVIPIEKVTGIFRVYQEALTNVARHAQATAVESTLCFNEAGITLTVADNGKGFDVHKAGAGKTLGLLGMRERVIAMRGQYNIRSKTSTGTSITVTIPL